MQLIVILGRHGTGKSTLGQKLTEMGYRHFSVGSLRRVAQRKSVPADIPFKLINLLRKDTGNHLSDRTCFEIIEFCKQFDRVVIDGLPETPTQVSLLPSTTRVIWMISPKSKRIERLQQRSLESARIWTPDRVSRREAILPLMPHALSDFPFLVINNRIDGKDLVSHTQSLERFLLPT
jgi:adenylate kinase family enzyme